MEKAIDIPLDEIASWFPPGLTSWMKWNSPEKWGRLLSIEKALNQASFELDEVRIEELLTEYRDFVKAMARSLNRERREGERILTMDRNSTKEDIEALLQQIENLLTLFNNQFRFMEPIQVSFLRG